MLEIQILKEEINKVDLYKKVQKAFVGAFINGFDYVGIKENEQTFHFCFNETYCKNFNYKIFQDLGEAVTYVFKKHNNML